jgi:peptidoglycan/LPS O-acetylase OafA/YrhL
MEVKAAAATWRLGHRAGLDGARGLAILLVVVGHVLSGEQAAAPIATLA